MSGEEAGEVPTSSSSSTTTTSSQEPSSFSLPANIHDIEKQEEDKLKIKYPAAAKPMAGHSAFLQKRLAKGQKYFDSGDYQMAKQTGKGKISRAPFPPPILSIAPEIPTPETVINRKTSVVQPSKLTTNS